MGKIERDYEFELDCRYDSRASFYGKARVVKFKDFSSYLVSYSTIVACITPDGKAHVKDSYSQTTTRHVKEYLKQSGFKAENLKQILKDYCDEEFDWHEFELDRW